MKNETLAALKGAADRCDGYLAQYGVDISWTLHPIGLQLNASYGADKVERFVGWPEADSAVDLNQLLDLHEMNALKGLSS